jgi:probable rRNA maturation factor
MEQSLYSGKIGFNDVDLNSNLKNKKNIRTWLDNACKKEKKKIGIIDFNFCSDKHLLGINIKYLNHDFYTDIITFDFSEQSIISGDIYISLERVKENAKLHGVTYSNELMRVLIHGVLHLCGYKDKTRKESALMREKEDHYLSLL